MHKTACLNRVGWSHGLAIRKTVFSGKAATAWGTRHQLGAGNDRRHPAHVSCMVVSCCILQQVHDTFLPLWETGNDHKKVWCNALLKPVVRKTAQARHTHGFFLVSYRDGTGVFICLFVNFFELLLFCLARPAHSCQWPKSGTRWGCGHVVIGTCPFLPSNIHARADTLFIILNLSIGPSVLWVLCTVGNASCIFL